MPHDIAINFAAVALLRKPSIKFRQYNTPLIRWLILLVFSLSSTILVTTSFLNHCLKSRFQPFILTFRPNYIPGINHSELIPKFAVEAKERNSNTIGAKSDWLSVKICFATDHKRSTSAALPMTWSRTWSSTILSTLTPHRHCHCYR